MLHKINKQVIANFLKDNDLTQSEASTMLGMSKSWLSTLVSAKQEYYTERTVDKLVSLGISRPALLSPSSTVETAFGKILEKPDAQLPKKDPKVEAAAKAVDENGERLSFEERMRSLGSDANDIFIKYEKPAYMEPVPKEPFVEVNDAKIPHEIEQLAHDTEMSKLKNYQAAYNQLVSDILDMFAKNPIGFDLNILATIQLVSKAYDLR